MENLEMADFLIFLASKYTSISPEKETNLQWLDG
jgi:hypothetical protein